MVAKFKSRMVSFRLSPEEYEQFRQICLATGNRNLSQLLRAAVNSFLRDGQKSDNRDVSLEKRVAHLELQLQTLRAEVKSQNPSRQDAPLSVATQA
jgi:hypothetical protein